MTSAVLVTGANRGIGLSLCKLYQSLGYQVYAACRQSSEALDNLGVTIISGIDVIQEDAGYKLALALGGSKLDLLINNAGILRNDVLGKLNRDQIRDQFETNALAPLMITEALLNNLKEGSKIGIITSRMGSIEDNTSGGRYGYRMSKVALNIAGKSLAQDLKPRGIALAMLHPGLVSTDMISVRGDITPDEAAERLAHRLDLLDLTTTGTFWHSNGDVLPW